MDNKFEKEIDLLLLHYTFSDQYGNVNQKEANMWADSKFGITLPELELKFKQEHLDFLMDHDIVPDTRLLFHKIKQ